MSENLKYFKKLDKTQLINLLIKKTNENNELKSCMEINKKSLELVGDNQKLEDFYQDILYENQLLKKQNKELKNEISKSYFIIENYKTVKYEKEKEYTDKIEKLEKRLTNLHLKMKDLKNPNSSSKSLLKKNINTNSSFLNKQNKDYFSIFTELKYQNDQYKKKLDESEKKRNELIIYINSFLKSINKKKKFSEYFKIKKDEKKNDYINTNTNSYSKLNTFTDTNEMTNQDYSEIYEDKYSDELVKCKYLISALFQTNNKLVILLNNLKYQFLNINKEKKIKNVFNKKKKRARSNEFLKEINIDKENLDFTLKSSKVFLKGMHDNFEKRIENLVRKMLYYEEDNSNLNLISNGSFKKGFELKRSLTSPKIELKF